MSPPLLTYAILPAPNPLAVSGGATLTLAISNGGREIVTVTSITMTIPLGTNAKDLTSATAISTTPAANWTIAQSSGAFTLTPSTPEAAKIGKNGLVFTFASIAVNDQPGTASIAIAETASSPSDPSDARSTAIAVPKFPASFTLSELTGPVTPVRQGGSAQLMWTGAQATYTITYDPDGNGAQTYAVGPVGPYTASGLTSPVVVFTLVAKVTVAGQDQPLVAQRQFVVTVTTVTINFTALPPSVGANGVTKLTWTTTGASEVTVSPHAGTGLSGSAYVVVPATQTFTLVATEIGSGQSVEQQQTVTVDPTIVPTSTQTFVGAAGRPGSPGTPGAPGRSGGTGGPGGPGGPSPGGSVDLGPLDPSATPSSVVQIVFAGGVGGRGGDGGPSGGGGGVGGRGGPGGPGGDAGKLTLRLGAIPTPQQIIVAAAPAKGGAGGNGAGGSPNGTPGNPGKAGTVQIVDAS
jgi:hypothetical protein